MNKNSAMSVALNQLVALNIPYVLNEGTDVLVRNDFLDAHWGAGKKTIHYEASVLFDEASKTVFMWEMTKENEAGLSFGSNNESSFQTGKTLLRKVKSVQYSASGQVYEIDLDLGAIPKAFKEAANQAGYGSRLYDALSNALISGELPENQALPQNRGKRQY